MEEELTEVKESVIALCKATFLWLSLIIILLEIIFAIDGENLLDVNDPIQFLGLYIFELLPCSYYIQVKKIERKNKTSKRSNP